MDLILSSLREMCGREMCGWSVCVWGVYVEDEIYPNNEIYPPRLNMLPLNIPANSASALPSASPWSAPGGNLMSSLCEDVGWVGFW